MHGTAGACEELLAIAVDALIFDAPFVREAPAGVPPPSDRLAIQLRDARGSKLVRRIVVDSMARPLLNGTAEAIDALRLAGVNPLSVDSIDVRPAREGAYVWGDHA